MKADLHCHSTHSDGTCTPFELVQLAEKVGLDGLSITDHDSISSYKAALEAKSEKVKLLPGVELSTVLGEQQVHVLGYAFNPDHAKLNEFCKSCREHRLDRNRKMLDKFRILGIDLKEEEIQNVTNNYTAYGRPHIAAALVKKGVVKDIQEAFRKYLGDGRPCYVPGEKYSVQDAINILHEAGGKAVIAHPHLAPNAAILDKLLMLNFDGIEVNYARFSGAQNQRFQKIANKKGWLATGGSDFHGTVKPEVELGISYAPQGAFERLWEHFQKQL